MSEGLFRVKESEIIKCLEKARKELLEALESCCIATKGKEKAFCECNQYNGSHCLDGEGICRFGERGDCQIWNAIQKAREIMR